VHNIEVARVFDELADLLELKGEDFFKIRAYRKAARVVAGLPEPVEKIWQRGQLGKVPGIGKNIAAKISELMTTGKFQKHEDLLREIPSGLLEIMSLPGIGPKRARVLWEGLGISSIAELEAAAREGRVRELPGIGGKSESDMLRNIEMRKNQAGWLLLDTARQLTTELLDLLKILPGVGRIEIGGSMRRWREAVRDIDLVVEAEDQAELFTVLARHPQVKGLLSREDNRARFATSWGVPLDVEVVSGDRFWSVLHCSTGSKEHYQKLQELALKRGLKLDSRGIRHQGEGIKPAAGEEDIYAQLGLPYIVPELRENRGEIEAALAGILPFLVELPDIKGDFHVHTDWSDGLNSIEQVAAAARGKGYSYIAVTDHSRSLKVARGLSLERLAEQHEVIRRLNEEQGFYIFTGVEADILPNGELDYPDDILSRVDVVIASVHSAFRQDREIMTERILAAVKNKKVDIIGHLTGRLLGQREAYALDIDRIMEAAAANGTILEINSCPDRLDLNEENARLAKERGVKLIINTDAHDIWRMDEMKYGVAVARRAWLSPEDIVNTMPLPELLDFWQNKKGKE
jgi:DNA polymerase (family 10)